MNGVELRFLGTGDAFGSGGRLHTSTLIRSEQGSLLVDCGPATLSALRRDGIEPGTVGAIVVTHLHGDHFAGIPFLLMDAHYSTCRTQPLIIAGPAGVEAAVARAQEVLFPGSGVPPLRFPVEWIEWVEGRTLTVGPAAVTPFPVAHSTVLACFGLRVEIAQRVLAFSGDTEWTDSLVALSADADVFVCECFGYETAPPHHLDFRTLKRHLHELTCNRLLLTHMGEEMLSRASELGVITASDGLALSI
jgi:ribonuclease BN (tRNA processing enzyme)